MRTTKVLRLFSMLLFLSVPFLLQAQAPVTGKVADENGRAITGVTVTVKATKRATVTDAQGMFSIPAAPQDILVFSSVGYGTVQVAASAASEVKLSGRYNALNDVVVVGYGTKQMKDVSSSIGSIKGDVLRKSPVATIDQALTGRLAGVQVTSSTGDPGGAITVRIRGLSTASGVGSNDPLYVVDDIVLPPGYNIGFINPSDVESIDVLKDASATAIYGIRAANGVVVVRTKKGTGKDKAKLTLDIYGGLEQPYKTIDVLNIRQRADLNNTMISKFNADNAGNPSFTPVPLNPAWSTPERLDLLPKSGTDWQDQVFHNGILTDVNLGLSGSSGKTNYYFSVSNRKEEGAILNSSFNRTSIRANVEGEVKDWLKVGMNFTYADVRRTVTGATNDDRSEFMQSTLFTPPEIPVRNADGSFGVAPVKNIDWYGNIFNPVNLITSQNPKYANQDLFGSLYGVITLPLNITFHSTFGIGRYSGSYANFGGSTQSIGGAPNLNTSLYAGTGSGYSWNWDNYFNWNKWINGHSIDVTAGHTAQYIYNSSFNYNQNNFSNQTPDFQQIGLGSSPVSFPYTPSSELSYESWFARLSYNYQERYYVQGSYRIDKGSPAYTTANKQGTFPSVSVKWRLSKEAFLKESNFFNELSLRGSYGISGNIGSAAYPGYSLVKQNSNYAFGGGQSVNGVSLAQFPNTGTAWEKTPQYDLGLDVEVMKGMFALTFDWYKRVTQGMLIQSKLRPTLGQTPLPPLENLTGNNIENTGLEFTVTYRKTSGLFHFNINVNASVSNNNVTDLNGKGPILPPDATYVGAYQPSRTDVGHPISSFYGFKVDGVYQNQAQVDKGPKDLLGRPGGSRPGDFVFEDLNGDGQIDQNDMTYIGNPTPTFTYGFSFNGSYKNFDFSFLIQGVSGNVIYNYLYQQGTIGDPRYGEGINRFADVLNAWHGEGTSNSLPQINYRDNSNGNNGRFSDYWLQSGAYARLKNLSIGYTLPEKTLKAIKMEKIRIYATANNLFTITKYKGFDPEVGINSTGYTDVFSGNFDLQKGIDRGVFPQPRIFIIGLNIGF